MSEDEALAAALRVLREQYLADAPDRLAELWSTFARVQFGDPAALEKLQSLTHRLAGTGGAYGFPGVTDAARAVELACRALRDAGRTPVPSELAGLRVMIEGVADAFGATPQE